MDMETGQIKYFDPQRGIGFIQADDGGPDLIVHRSAINTEAVASISQGMKVCYETEVYQQGTRAVAVRPLEESSRKTQLK